MSKKAATPSEYTTVTHAGKTCLQKGALPTIDDDYKAKHPILNHVTKDEWVHRNDEHLGTRVIDQILYNVVKAHYHNPARGDWYHEIEFCIPVDIPKPAEQPKPEVSE